MAGQAADPLPPGSRTGVARLLRAFPDQELDNHPYRVFFASGDWTCSIARFRGTFAGPMKGPDGTDVPPTGKKFDVEFCTVARWGEDGRIVEENLSYDLVSFMQQTGLGEYRGCDATMDPMAARGARGGSARGSSLVASPESPHEVNQSLDTESYNTYILSMTASLRDELRQQKPFGSLHQEAFLNVARTGAVLHDGLDRVLGPHGLSLTQYNVLRMLRGAGQDGLCRNEIRDRLITRMPDVSRLLDRMEAAGLVHRVRGTADRRLVNTTLTDHGRAVVDRLDDELTREHERQLGHLNERQLRTLIELLSLARAKA